MKPTGVMGEVPRGRYQMVLVVARIIVWYYEPTMTAIYEQSGIRFLYPENWALDNRDDTGRPWSVSVHSPSGAFWSLTVYDDPAELAQIERESLEAVREEYSESIFETVAASEKLAGHELAGQDINFFYLDFLISARLRVFRIGDQSCVVLYQAEDRDFETLQRVFEAITLSLFSPELHHL